MDPVLVVLWLVGLIFFVAGLLTYRYVIGGRTRNSWAAPRTMEPIETPEDGTLLEQQIDEIMKQWP